MTEPLDESLLRIGAAIATAHAAAFQEMMLDVIQRDGDPDRGPVRTAVLAAMQPGDPTGAGQHILDAVRTTLSAHKVAGQELTAMADDGSPLAILAGMTGMDPAMTAASSYALHSLQLAVDATIAAIAALPEVAAIAQAATGEPDAATGIAARAGLPLTMLATLLAEDGTVPLELAAAARGRITSQAG